jgi:hypothetical protein
MDNKIPDHIKSICAKPKLDDPDINNEQELVKKAIVEYLEYYLDIKKGGNSLADVTGIIRNEFECKWTVYTFERDIGGRMMRTRNYTMRETINEGGGKEILVIAADRDWWDKYSGWFSLASIVLAFILGLLGEPIKNALFSKTPTNKDTVSVKILQMPQILPRLPDHQNDVQPFPDSLKMDSSKH